MLFDSHVRGPKYRCHQNHGYTLLNNLRPALDVEAVYFIDTCAAACKDRPVIVRCDGRIYGGNMRWIVDRHNLTEIDESH